jgi:hypothetical protein
MRHAIAYRLGLVLVLGAVLGPAAATAVAEEDLPAAPTAPSAAQPPAPQGEAKPADAKPPKPPATRFLTEEEVRKLPVFTRLDDASFQKILAKGKTLLADVKDNTFDYDEEAFYWLLHLVSRLQPDLLKPDAEPLPYSALLATPSLYRGEPVTIRGSYLSVEKHHVPALALRKDVPYMYPCTIKEHEKPLLATVIVLEDPMKYLRVEDDVFVKGYFYKVRRYRSIGGNEDVAPMIIAQRLVPADQVGAAEVPAAGDRPRGGVFSDPSLMIGLGVVAVLIGAFITLRVLIRKPKYDGKDPRKPQVHKFRLRRPDRIEPPAGGGPGGAGGGPKP